MSGSSLGTALKEIESLNRQLNKAQKAESQVILCALVSCESTKFRRAKPPLAHAAQVKVLQSKLTMLQGDFQQLQESKNSFLAAPLTTSCPICTLRRITPSAVGPMRPWRGSN